VECAGGLGGAAPRPSGRDKQHPSERNQMIGWSAVYSNLKVFFQPGRISASRS
jgi:hypothetical protein